MCKAIKNPATCGNMKQGGKVNSGRPYGSEIFQTGRAPVLLYQKGKGNTMIYQEELNAIREAVDNLEGLQAEEQDTMEEMGINQAFDTIETLTGIVAKVKAAGMEKPDLQDAKRGLVYDLEAIAHKIIVKAGRYWRTDIDDFSATSDFTDEIIGSAFDLISSIADAKAALIATMQAAGTDQEGGKA